MYSTRRLVENVCQFPVEIALAAATGNYELKKYQRMFQFYFRENVIRVRAVSVDALKMHSR